MRDCYKREVRFTSLAVIYVISSWKDDCCNIRIAVFAIMTPDLFPDLFCLCEEMQTSWLHSEYDIRKEYIYTGSDP